MKIFKSKEQKCLTAGIQCATIEKNHDTKRRRVGEQL